jgi:hypothetical protein
MAMDGLCIGVFFGIKGHSPAYIESKTEYWSSTYGWEKKGTFYPTMLLGQDLRLTASTFFELMQHFCVSSCVMSNARLWMSPVSSSVFVLYKYQMAPIFKRHCSKSPLNTVTTGGWVEWQHLIELWDPTFFLHHLISSKLRQPASLCFLFCQAMLSTKRRMGHAFSDKCGPAEEEAPLAANQVAITMLTEVR